jgi:hypothetical protein
MPETAVIEFPSYSRLKYFMDPLCILMYISGLLMQMVYSCYIVAITSAEKHKEKANSPDSRDTQLPHKFYS